MGVALIGIKEAALSLLTGSQDPQSPPSSAQCCRMLQKIILQYKTLWKIDTYPFNPLWKVLTYFFLFHFVSFSICVTHSVPWYPIGQKKRKGEKKEE